MIRSDLPPRVSKNRRRCSAHPTLVSHSNSVFTCSDGGAYKAGRTYYIIKSSTLCRRWRVTGFTAKGGHELAHAACGTDTRHAMINTRHTVTMNPVHLNDPARKASVPCTQVLDYPTNHAARSARLGVCSLLSQWQLQTATSTVKPS